MDSSRGAQLVVVGVDGSAESTAALQWAARYAKATRAQVRVVRAWHLPDLPGYVPPRVESDLSRAVEQGVERQVRDVFGEYAVDVVVEEAGAVRLLLREAKQADALVLGVHGDGHDGLKLVGSTTQSCLLHAACPVVVVPLEGRSS